MSNYATILNAHFDIPVPNEDLTLLRDIKALHPNSQHVALENDAFPLSTFLQAHSIDVAISEDPTHRLHQLFAWNPKKNDVYAALLTGVLAFRYDGTDFTVYKVTWTRECQRHTLYDFVFDGGREDDRERAGRVLVAAVYKWAKGLKDEIWVFQQGQWTKDKVLWSNVQASSWDDLVLDPAFLEDLRRDTQTFFASHDIYKSLGIVWKRGLLLLGPPGNGKTESIKVLLKETGQAALYVKSFTTQQGPEYGVRTIFEHARNNAPCILVIEDLDAMVTPEVRSFFLNELDGIGQNEGILTIATTNHPERIDDAILNRPSRFDVKYNFALPTHALRARYATAWLAKTRTLAAGSVAFTRTDAELAAEIARTTDGWSFAFLKELFVSFLLRVAHDRSRSKDAPTRDGVDALLLETAERLSVQILKVQYTNDDGASAGRGSAPMDTTRFINFVPGAVDVFHGGSNI